SQHRPNPTRQSPNAKQTRRRRDAAKPTRPEKHRQGFWRQNGTTWPTKNGRRSARIALIVHLAAPADFATAIAALPGRLSGQCRLQHHTRRGDGQFRSRNEWGRIQLRLRHWRLRIQQRLWLRRLQWTRTRRLGFQRLRIRRRLQRIRSRWWLQRL